MNWTKNTEANWSGGCPHELRPNTYDQATGVVTIDPIRAEAFAANVDHYRTVFIDGNADYAIPAGAVSSEDRLHKLSAFIFWTSWAAVDHAAWRHRQLHQQLAARTARRQPTDRRQHRLDGRQRHHVAGRNLRDGMVVRIAQRRGRRRCDAGVRSTGAMGGNAVAKSNHQVLLGRCRA